MTEISRIQLDQALPDVMAAPKDRAAIGMLCLRPERNQRKFVDQIEVSPQKGIAGERWLESPWLTTPEGAPHPGIQISILQQRVLDLVWQDRENTPHPGDTFVVDMDLSHDNLPVGQLLSVGTAILKVSDVFNDGCVKWKARYGAAAKDWIVADDHPKLRLRGVLCSVERAGLLKAGDFLTKIAAK